MLSQAMLPARARRSPIAAGALVAFSLAIAPQNASAVKPSVKQAAPKGVPPIPVAVAVAVDDRGKPVCGEDVVQARFDEAARLFATMELTIVLASLRTIPAAHAALETRDDRDALRAHLLPRVVNVFFVSSLRDVDEPERMRMGVHWRARPSPKRHYAIVTCAAATSTLAHELGHFFGNAHTPVEDNVMSYNRTGGAVFFDVAQGRRSRQMSRRFLASGEVVACTGPDASSCPSHI